MWRRCSLPWSLAFRDLPLFPDLVLMDIKMPGLNGVEATRAIRHTSPHIAVLIITLGKVVISLGQGERT